jgi:STE24 endopeptidase
MTEVMGIVLLLIGLKYAMGQYLDGLNLRHALSRRHQVPVPYQDFIDLQAYQKSIDYTVTKTRFSRYQAAFDDGLLVVVLLTGFLPLLYAGLTYVLGEGIWGQSLVLIAILGLLSLPSLPFDWWSTFRIEQRFGFNKSSIALWLSDKAKGALIGFVFLCPLLALLLYCVESAGEIWWMWGFGLFFSFQVLMVVLYPMFILPLFNQLKPMAAGDLRERLFALAERTGFQAQTILVMDGINPRIN